jgi:hypothetical protein
MSYCTGANEEISWISTRFWHATLAGLTASALTLLTFGPLAEQTSGGVRPQVQPTLLVDAFVDSGSGTVVLDTVELDRGRPSANNSGGRYHSIVRDINGNVLSDTGFVERRSHSDGAADLIALRTRIPADPATASTEITFSGRVVHSGRGAPVHPAC